MPNPHRLPMTTPHEAMRALDDEGESYTVTFNFAGCPKWKDAVVFAHGPDWMLVGSGDGQVFINMRHVLTIQVNEV